MIPFNPQLAETFGSIYLQIHHTPNATPLGIIQIIPQSERQFLTLNAH